MMSKRQILYVTAVYLGGEENGGTLVCREHIRTLSSLENVDLTIITLGPGGAIDFLKDYGAKHFNLSYRLPKGPLRPSKKSLRPAARWPFVWELKAHHQPQLKKNIEAILKLTHPIFWSWTIR